MRCPNDDGELIAHTAQGTNGLALTYSTCPLCRGYWMDSFAANYIKIPAEKPKEKQIFFNQNFSCPVCQKKLARETEENIPDNVWVYRCPDGHGYFFPAGQLTAFKAAQQAKISYHKLWNIPIPGVASVLLAGLLLFVLVGAVGRRQLTVTQAKQLLVSQRTFVVRETNDVLFMAQTSAKATLTLRIGKREEAMQTRDGTMHMIVLHDLPAGTYSYSFAITTAGAVTQSRPFTLVVP